MMIGPNGGRNFLFEDIWPFLKLSQIIGIFPYKKIHEENGIVRLVPMNKWLSGLRVVLTFLLYAVALIVTLLFSNFDFEKMKDLVSKTLDGSTTSTGMVYNFGILTPIMISCLFLLTFGNYRKKWQEFYLTLNESNLFLNSKSMNKFFTVPLILFYYGYSLFALLMVANILKQNDIVKTFFSVQVVIGLFLCSVINFMIYFLPTTCFLVIFKSLVTKFRSCIDNLKSSEYWKTKRFPYQWAKEVLELINMIELTSDLLSFQCFVLITQFVIIFIGTIYNIVHISISDEKNFFLRISPQISYGVVAFIIFYMLNFSSEEIKDKIQELKKIVLVIEASDEQEFEVDGMLHKESYARSLIAEKLGDFQGFDMGGFSKLGKPLLGSIATNTITYLIVLIQFKLSEK